MNKVVKILIVAALVVAVAIVIAFKYRSSSATNETSKQVPVTKPQPASGMPMLVDIGSDTCVPCKMMAPILEQLKKEYKGKLIVEFVDVRKDPDIASRYRIIVIPTQIFFDASGTEHFRHEGFMSKEDILARWKELGIDLKND